MAATANWAKLNRVEARNGVTRRVFSGEKSMMVLNELMPSAKPASRSSDGQSCMSLMPHEKG